MTHLSWDEFGARVLERRVRANRARPGAKTDLGLKALVVEALTVEALGRIKCSGFVVSLWPR
ncbi:methionyl-tRNA formyltransferase [Bradyrhizobium centrosematis]|nr:methionyl-tRNA formyltransferase [Bradyrhizobium centrosematis]MCS3777434.1 methionyl-tRNA formyltransferase [Bradyrhizobium centrosematis]